VEFLILGPWVRIPQGAPSSNILILRHNLNVIDEFFVADFHAQKLYHTIITQI